MDSYPELKEKIRRKGFKATPQRIIVLEALARLNHPTAEQVSSYVQQHYPGVATGTVYQTLDSFAHSGLVTRVFTGSNVMRFEAVTGNHHHLYCSECDMIADYFDEELDNLLEEYFRKKRFPGSPWRI